MSAPESHEARRLDPAPEAAYVGVLMVVGSAILFSSKAILAKLAYRYGSDAPTILALRMAFALPIFLASALVSERKAAAKLPRKVWLQLALLGSLGYYLAALLDFAGLQYVSAGLERLILFLYPTMVLALNALFQGERPSPRLLQAIALSYAGVGLVVFHDRVTFGPGVALGSALVFGGALAYASYLSFAQPLIRRYGSVRITSHVLVVACLCSFAQFAATHAREQPAPALQVVLLCAAIGLLATVAPAYLLSAGIARMGASRASLVGSIGPVATLLLAYLVLDEPIGLLQIAGSALVLLGVLRVTPGS